MAAVHDGSSGRVMSTPGRDRFTCEHSNNHNTNKSTSTRQSTSSAARTTAAMTTPTDRGSTWHTMRGGSGKQKTSFSTTKALACARSSAGRPTRMKPPTAAKEAGSSQRAKIKKQPTNLPVSPRPQPSRAKRPWPGAAAIAGEAPLAGCCTWAHSISPRRRYLAKQ